MISSRLATQGNLKHISESGQNGGSIVTDTPLRTLFPRSIIAVIIFALVIRLLIAPFTAHPFDLWAWYYDSLLIKNGSFPPFYFPPYIMTYLLWLVTVTYDYLAEFTHPNLLYVNQLNPVLKLPDAWGVQLVPDSLFNLIVKVPFIISDILVGYLVYKIVLALKGSKDLAIKASSMWLLNPIVIWISSGWGMFDSLPTLFTVLSFFVAFKRKGFLSAIFIIVAVSLKLYPVVMLIPLLLYFWYLDGKHLGRNTISFLVGLATLSAIFYIPYLPSLLQSLSTLFSSAPIGQSGSLPPQGVLTYWSASLLAPVPSLVTNAVLLLGAVSMVILYLRTLLKGFPQQALSLVSTLLSSLFIIFLTFRSIAENFVLWLIPFMIILVASGKLESKLFWLISLVAFLSSITSTLLPLYLLPLYPWIGDYLVQLMQLIQPYRVVQNGTFSPGISFGSLYLFLLGTFFSILILLSLIEVLFDGGYRFIDSFLKRVRIFLGRLA